MWSDERNESGGIYSTAQFRMSSFFFCLGRDQNWRKIKIHQNTQDRMCGGNYREQRRDFGVGSGERSLMMITATSVGRPSIFWSGDSKSGRRFYFVAFGLLVRWMVQSLAGSWVGLRIVTQCFRLGGQTGWGS